MATEVLGKENVHTLLMPSQFSSDHSVEDARAMAENLGMNYQIVPITNIFALFTQTISPIFGELPFDLAEDNIQSRLRGTMLMALANKFGYILLNTSNKSEYAVGNSTLYGDSAGILSVIGDLYKSEVYDLARYINRNGEIIPRNTLSKAPTSELHPNHPDANLLPAYDILDAILYRMLEEGQSREEIINAGFDEEDVYRIYGLLIRNEHKRYQSSPVLRLTRCVLCKNRIMPLTSHYGY